MRYIFRNNEIKNLENLTYIYGDRKYLKDFSMLINYINNKYGINEDNKWECVVDFSAFKPLEVYVNIN